MKELGKLVKDARERRGLRTQQAAADAIGLTLSKYNRLENGTTKELPVPDDLRRISDALGLSMEDMLIAAGYLEVPDTDHDAVVIVRKDDPRADLLRVLNGATDAEISKALEIIKIVTGHSPLERDKPAPLDRSHTDTGFA